MAPMERRHPSSVAEWDDARRRARLRETRLGHGWITLRRTRLAAVRIAAVLMVVLVAFGQYWAHDVAPERIRLSRTAPALFTVAPAADERDRETAVVDMVGLGGLDARGTAASLPSLRALGQVWAVRYDNAGLDTKVIADQIVRAAVLAGVQKIVLVGHSMGGVVALEVGRHIHAGDSEQRLIGVLLDCTPVDLDAVRPESRGLGEDMVRWMRWLPGARESRGLRLAVETYARRDRYLDLTGVPGIRWGELGAVLQEVLRDKIFNDNAAGNGLIESQFLAIAASGAVGDLRALERAKDDKPKPAIVFLRPRNPSADTVVDVRRSHEVLVDTVGGTDGSLLVVRPDNTGHANPQQRPREYNTVIERQVVPFLDRHEREIDTTLAAAAAERAARTSSTTPAPTTPSATETLRPAPQRPTPPSRPSAGPG